MPPAASDAVDSDRSGPPIDVPDRTVPGSDSRQENGPKVEPIEEIDQYMLELLDRVNQRSNKSGAEERRDREESPKERTAKTTAEGSPQSPAIERSEVSPSAPTVDREAAGSPGPSPQQPIPQQSVEPYRTTPPPEHACDLAAMRDLANESAEEALAQFESRQLIRTACGKFSVVAMGVCSAVLLYLMSGANGWFARVSIGVALSVAVVWSGLAFILWIQGIIRRRPSSRLASGTTGDRESIRS